SSAGAYHRTPLSGGCPVKGFCVLLTPTCRPPGPDNCSPFTAVPKPVSQVMSTDLMHPPLYYVLLNYWIQLPWTLSPLASMRAMSAVWALVATVVIYALWLRREGPRFQAMFLALWVL